MTLSAQQWHDLIAPRDFHVDLPPTKPSSSLVMRTWSTKKKNYRRVRSIFLHLPWKSNPKCVLILRPMISCVCHYTGNSRIHVLLCNQPLRCMMILMLQINSIEALQILPLKQSMSPLSSKMVVTSEDMPPKNRDRKRINSLGEIPNKS